MSTTVASLSEAKIASLRARFPDALEPDVRRLWMQRTVVVGVFGYLALCCWVFDITFARLFGGLDKMWVVIRSMVIWKDMETWDYAGIFQGLAETLGMAFLGTFVATLLAMVLGFVAARNVVSNLIIHHLVRRFLDLLRGVDTLIWALVFVRAVGLGPLAGVLSIMVSDTGTLSKLYSEAVENVDQRPIEGVRSTGASALKICRFGYLPQVLPVFLSTSLYWFESNTRSATILGIVGAGGIGMQLSERMKVQYWDQACFIILLILITVAIIDMISKWIRMNLIGKREL